MPCGLMLKGVLLLLITARSTRLTNLGLVVEGAKELRIGI